jgi:hypothetical protein
MRYLIVIIIVFMSISSCVNEKQTIKDLAKNEISDFRYLLEYIETFESYDSCFSPRNFNHLYNYLRIIPLNDSSWVFIRNICLGENDKNDFLLLFKNDSIRIYKPVDIMSESVLWYFNTSIFFNYKKAMECSSDTAHITNNSNYFIRYSYYKRWPSIMNENEYKYEFNSLWERDDHKYFKYMEYRYDWKLSQNYVYEKTIKNKYIRSSLKFCNDSILCCPFDPGVYGSEEAANETLNALRQRIW